MAKKPSSEKPTGGASIQNRKARFDYEVIDSYEAGLVLVGSEVKSIWLGRANLVDAYCDVRNGEIFLLNLDVEPYVHSAHYQPERRRERKLLLHSREIEVIHRRSQEKGLSIIPLALYFKNGKVKVQIALARGKKQYDKRHSIAENETRREVERLKKKRL